MINPRIGLLDKIGPISVYRVDGALVRKSLDPNFTNFGQHHRFPFIPKSEFWLDKQGKPGEDRYFIDHLLKEHSLMAKGVPYNDALKAGDAVEKRERNRLRGRKTKANIKKTHVGTTKSGTKIHLVDGNQVRSALDTDFVEGGHDLAYPRFVPKGEVWLDDNNAPEEMKPNLLHELHERRLMRTKGLGYDEAHRRATRIEHEARANPNTIDKRLQMELGRA